MLNYHNSLSMIPVTHVLSTAVWHKTISYVPAKKKLRSENNAEFKWEEATRR